MAMMSCGREGKGARGAGTLGGFEGLGLGEFRIRGAHLFSFWVFLMILLFSFVMPLPLFPFWPGGGASFCCL